MTSARIVRRIHFALLVGGWTLFAVGLLYKQLGGALAGGLIHDFSRLHPWLTHVSMGLATVSLLWLGNPRLRSLSGVALLALDLTFFTGALGNWIEGYPNENIRAHMLWAASACGLSWLTIKLELRTTRPFALLAILGTGFYGGTVHKGTGYFSSAESLSDLVANSHPIVVHFVLAAILVAVILKRFRIAAAIFCLSLFSGVLLAIRLAEWTPRSLTHYSLGTLTLLSCLIVFKMTKPRIQLAFALLAISSGVFLEFGPVYFRPATRWSVADARESGILIDHQFEKFMESTMPILEKKCISCHDGSNSNTGVRLDSFASLRGGNKFYNLIQAGEVDRSGLFRSIVMPLSEGGHMPRFEGMLSQSEIDGVRQWIETGGFSIKEPARGLASSNKIGQDHWSLKRAPKPPIPSSQLAGATPIDAFIFSEISKTTTFKLEPVSRERLIRDLYLDVTGLLPEAGETKRFLAGTDRYEEVVDRLLRSPRFGENLALFWLDFTGFGETGGFEKQDSRVIKGSLEYKKSIIKVLNGDQSYFRLLRSQLEKSSGWRHKPPEDQWVRYQPRYGRDSVYAAGVAMQTLYSFSLGLQMKCANCHNHIYAPISNDDYYSQLEPWGSLDGTTLDSLSSYRFRKNRGPLRSHFLSMFESTRSESDFWTARQPGSTSGGAIGFAALADWLTDTKDGVGFFTARVFVNALWSYIMGRGIVDSEGDWMRTPAPPPHVDLLNYLTHDFIEHGTSVKRLVRNIVVSKYYQNDVWLGAPALSEKLSLSSPAPLRPEIIHDIFFRITGKLMERAPRPKELEKDYLSRDPWRKREPGFRYVYFARARPGRDALSQHFEIPAGYKSVVQRSNEASMDEAMFFLTSDHFAEIERDLARKFGRAIDADQSAGVDSVYLSFFSRHPTSAEEKMWRAFFKEPGARLGMFFRILASSQEFITNRAPEFLK